MWDGEEEGIVLHVACQDRLCCVLAIMTEHTALRTAPRIITEQESVFYCTKCIIDMDIMVSKKKKCEVGDVRGGWTVRRLHQTSSCHEPQTWRTPVAGALKLYFTREQHPVALPRAAVPRS